MDFRLEVLIGLLILAQVTKVEPFSFIKHPNQCLKCFPSVDRRALHSFKYGRGDEIWPPTNEEFRIDLSDSLVDPTKRPMASTRIGSRRSIMVLTAIFISTIAKVDQVSYLPLDALLLVALSGYFFLLHRLDILSTPTTEDTAMIVHYKEPLGPILAQNVSIWENIGLYVGIILPYLCLFWQNNSSWQSVLIRPLLLYCAQALTEKLCEDSALPIRALVPIVYNVVRLGYLIYLFITLDELPGVIVSTLGLTNLVYCSTNLLLVLPFLALRYLRTHCFLVEAKSVELQSEISIGLTPR